MPLAARRRFGHTTAVDRDTSKAEAGDPRFYVVGGAVQPGRDCYIHRAADAELLQRLADGEYCYVLAQRQMGKSSLAAATAARLRALETGVAVVDLTQASAEDPTQNAGRWYYSIAYRICRDLRLRADLQAWWAERGGLTNLQRLREFFQEIVLAGTERPVTVFFDRVEATLAAPMALDLFACVRACYDARATNPEFGRLTFALLSSAAPRELVRSVQGSPFEIAGRVPLTDFTAQEMAGLLAGLSTSAELAEEVNARVWSWTHGHPYLSQKVYRGLARRPDSELSAAVVDALVQTQFLAPRALHDDPHLAAIAAEILRGTKTRTARLNLYGRISKGIKVRAEPRSVPEQELTVAGLVVAMPNGELRVRNEIYARVFSTRWVNANLPIGVPSLAAAAIVLAAIIAVPVWYSEYLPGPYIAALTAPQQDAQSAAAAFRSLHRLPGFAATAERLYTNYLRRSGLRATQLPDVQAVNAALTSLPGGDELAAELQATYWDRVTNRRMHAGDRDGALLAAIEALERPTPVRRRRAGELVGPDYPNLLGTVHSDAAIQSLAADAGKATVTLLTTANAIDRWSVDGLRPVFVRRTAVTAEEHLPLELRRYFETVPRRPRVLLALQHSKPEQLDVRLRAPSGQEASLALTPANALGQATYAFDFSRYPELGALLAGTAQGSWTLLVTDTVTGVAGEVLAWDIVGAPSARLSDTVSVEQPIPEPRQIEAARVQLGAAGRLALAWPQRVANAGSLQVWDLDTEAVVARLPHTAALRDARFALGGRLILTLDGPLLRVWDTAKAASLGTIPFSGEDFTALAVARNGRFAAWALPTTDPAEQPVIVVWDLLALRETGRIVAASDMAALAVDASGQHLAQGGADNFLRVWSVQEGTLTREFVLSAPARALHFDGSGEWLAADDLSNTFRVWDLREVGAPVLERAGTSRWQVGFGADSSVLIFGAFDRPYETLFLRERRRGVTALRHPAIPDAERPSRRLPVMLLERRDLVVTADAVAGLKVWQLPAPASGLRSESAIEPGVRSALTDNGGLVATGTRLQDLRLYAAGETDGLAFVAAESGAETQPVELVDLRFSAGRDWLAAAATDGRVHIWNTASGQPVLPPILHADGPALLARFVAADRYLVSASRLQVQVTDMQSGATVGRLRIQTDNPNVAYAPATGQLYVADGARGVVRWDWRSGSSAPVVPGSRAVTRLAVTADGQRLVTAGADLQLRLWDLNAGQMLAETIQAAGEVDALWLSANGRRLTVQAGHWLHTAAVTPAGIAHRYTRLLPSARLRVQPQPRGDTAVLLRPGGAGRPTVEPFALATPAATALPGQADVLRTYWRARLALDVRADGEIVQELASPAAD